MIPQPGVRTYRRTSVLLAVSSEPSVCCRTSYRIVLPDGGAMSQHSDSRFEAPCPHPPTAVPAATNSQPATPTMFLMVGLPGSGKTTRANDAELALTERALRLTPDHWQISLFGNSIGDFQRRPGGERWVLEGRLISVALQALRLGTSVVLDFGLWSRDERSALRFLARSVGASCRVVYLPVDKATQFARILHRQATSPEETFAMSEADIDVWREQFQPPDAAELDGTADNIPDPPTGWPDWTAWAAVQWPSCTDG